MATNLDPVLVRQLRRAGVEDAQLLPAPDKWQKFLSAINEHYRHMNDDRALLTRSMDLSTSELDALRERIEAQRDQLSGMVNAIGDVLGIFTGIVDAEAEGSNVTDIQRAKNEFTERLGHIFQDESSADSSQVSGVHAKLVNLGDQLIRLLSQTAEKAQMRKELEVARAVQMLLVPPHDLIERPFLSVAGHFEPANECGGDWWGVYDLDANRTLTMIGDVTGHGISAAIITGAAKASCDLACQITGGNVGPGDVLKMMNTAIHETARRQIMMTCSATMYDAVNKTMTLASAGHHFPLHVHRGQVRPVVAHGQPLGAGTGSTYETTTVAVEPGDVLVSFTDGLVELENEHGEPFGDKRVRAIAQRAASGGARAVRDAIVESFDSFLQGTARIDDVTMIVVAIK